MNNDTCEQFENIETLDGQQSGKAGQFEDLVERLALAIRDAYSGGAEHSTESDMRRARKDVRTVLDELAKTGVEEAVPSADDIAAWTKDGIREGEDATAIAATIWDDLATIAPILAAKDAELARRAEEIERMRKRLGDDATPSMNLTHPDD